MLSTGGNNGVYCADLSLASSPIMLTAGSTISASVDGVGSNAQVQHFTVVHAYRS